MAQTVNYAYIFFDVRNFTGSSTLTSFSLPNTPVTFIPDLKSYEEFANLNLSTKLVRWDFGDGNTSTELTPTHWYQWPGKYRVRLSVFDTNGNSFDSSYTPEITIYNFVNDYLDFQDLDKFILDVPAGRITTPLTLLRRNSWQSYPALSATGYTIMLYASGAMGEYNDINIQSKDKWSHLRALSRFYIIEQIGNNEEYVPVDKTTTTNTEIYARVIDNKIEVCDKNDEGSIFAGTTGYAVIYYSDDKAKNYESCDNPIFVFASFDNSKFKDEYTQYNNTFEYVNYPPYGFQNLRPAVMPLLKVRHNSATKLSITTTGIDGEGNLSASNFNMPKISWQNTEIPFVIRMKDDLNFTTKTYPPLSCIPETTKTLSFSSLSLFSGGQTIEAYKIYTTGTTAALSITGNYDALSVPDRFIISYEDQVLFDTGFRGSSTYNNQLTSLGYSPVVGPGVGSLVVTKPQGTTDYFILSVIAPLGGTSWSFSIDFGKVTLTEKTRTPFNLQIDLVQKDPITNISKSLTGITFYEDFNPDIPQSIGAFYKGYFVSPYEVKNCALTASMLVVDPLYYPGDTLVGWIAAPQYNKLMRFFRQSVYSYCPGSLTLSISSTNFYYNAYLNRNVYAIQVAPSGSNVNNSYCTWFADGSKDTLIKFDIRGNLLSSFALSAYPVKQPDNSILKIDLRSNELDSAAPGSLALDGNNDLWIALFDSLSAIKIDGVDGYVKGSALLPVTDSYPLSSDYNIPYLSGFAGENLLLPSSIDTDLDNNLWVAYTHPVYSKIAKFDTTGKLLFIKTLPELVSPVEICVDRNNNAWITAYNLSDNVRLSGTQVIPSTPVRSLTARNDYLYKFDKDGNTVAGYPLTGFKFIGNISVDGSQNAWVIQNKDTLTKIDALTNNRTNYIAGSGILSNKTSYVGSIGGIAVDSCSKVWVIHNFENKMYYIDSYLPPPTGADMLEYTQLYYPIDEPLSAVKQFETKEFQAYGDWLGGRWLNKYGGGSTETRIITGESSLFDILPYTGEYNVQKINEDFDAEGYFNSLVLAEHLQDKPVFFNNFLGTIVGGTSAQPYELGKTIYEKIANYVDNHADIDKSNIDQLISFCKELSIQFEQYNYPFPPQLMRLMNILSIKHKILWGDLNKYAYDFNNFGAIYNSNYAINLGTELSTLTSNISSGIPVVAYETFSDKYTLVNVNLISIGNNVLPYKTVLPLSTYSYDWGWGLIAPKSLSGTRISDYYRFYNYIEKYDGEYFNNIIDWANPLTTLKNTNSSFKTWSNDDGIMQNMLSYELTKGLRLFLSGSNLVYNN